MGRQLLTVTITQPLPNPTCILFIAGLVSLLLCCLVFSGHLDLQLFCSQNFLQSYDPCFFPSISTLAPLYCASQSLLLLWVTWRRPFGQLVHQCMPKKEPRACWLTSLEYS